MPLAHGELSCLSSYRGRTSRAPFAIAARRGFTPHFKQRSAEMPVPFLRLSAMRRPQHVRQVFVGLRVTTIASIGTGFLQRLQTNMRASRAAAQIACAISSAAMGVRLKLP